MKLQASAVDSFTRVEPNFVDFRLVKRSNCFHCETASFLYDLFFGFIILFPCSKCRFQNTPHAVFVSRSLDFHSLLPHLYHFIATLVSH